MKRLNCRTARRGWFFFLGLWIALICANCTAAEPGRKSATQRLGGLWRLAEDPENKGRAERWFEGIQAEAKEAPVPGMIQQVFPGYHGAAWYWHEFTVQVSRLPGERVLLRFGAVDYMADVWVNSKHVGNYEGGETPFDLDVTSALNANGANLLAVRVLNPADKPIDGYMLGEIPHRNKVVTPTCGCSFDSGGILYPVELRSVPPVYVDDIFVQPDISTGRLGITVTVRNTGPGAAQGSAGCSVSPACGGEVLQNLERFAEFPVGLSEFYLEAGIDQPRLWNLDDPYLYRVVATISPGATRPHQRSVRCGFRELRVVDGYFHLNGRRIFLKSTHTGNAMPIGQQTVPTSDFGRRDMIYAKASGFNTVRFIAGVADPEQLDLCDELGLMVYEECLASWLLGDSPRMRDRFDGSTSAMIRRDRNHPSVTMWGLLNETQDGPVFRHAMDFLSPLRRLDPTRLVLLGSGRWDGQLEIGSASNPGGNVWEPVWGAEGTGAASSRLGDGGFVPHAGDAHFYPGVPQSAESSRLIRELGRESKPVFLSEYGIGSEMNVIDEWRHFQQAGARPDLEDAALLYEQSEAFAADWTRLGFEGVYAFPEDLLRESQRLHARQRTLGFDLIRSNPKLCGYNLTGMLDHGMTGEGLWTFWREWKPAVFDAVTDGWSPLRWCLFADPMHLYAGRSVTVEAVLASEDALPAGEYPARFRVLGPAGLVWEKTAIVKVSQPPALAIPVMRETFELKGPSGAYVLAASLENGGAPTGGRLQFQVSDPMDLPKLRGEACLWGIDPKAEKWLSEHGLSCQPMTLQNGEDKKVILVGHPDQTEAHPELWENLKSRLAKGAAVVFLSGEVFQHGKAAMEWLPLKNKGRCRDFNDWLYHKECVARRHPVFEGLAGPGIMDWDYYGPIIPRAVFEGFDTPDDTIAAAFATGNSQYPRGYGSSLLMARYNVGSGWLILSTPRLLENLELHPAAGRLLANLVHYAQRTEISK